MRLQSCIKGVFIFKHPHLSQLRRARQTGDTHTRSCTRTQLKMKFLILSTVLVALASGASLDNDVNQGFEKPERTITCQYPFEDLYGFGCYFLSQYQMSHDEADEVCQNSGGHLVEIESQAEQNRLVDYVRQTQRMRQTYSKFPLSNFLFPYVPYVLYIPKSSS